MDLKQLKQEIFVRKKNQQKIRESVQKYAFEKYGVDFAIVDVLGEPEGFEVCLARQIATANTEHAAVSVFSAWLTRHMDYKVTGRFLSFSRDTYFPNPYKRSLVRLPQLKRGRKGPFLHYEKVASPCQGQVLLSIKTKGILLPDFHHEVLKNVVCGQKVSDLAGYFRNFAKSLSKHGPSYVYLRSGDFEKKTYTFDLTDDDFRPPAEWYYLPHLLLFVDGARGLLCTVNSRRSGPEYFLGSIAEIKREVGVEPLLIPVLAEIPWEEGNVIEPRGEYIFPDAILKSGWQSEIKISSSSSLSEVFEDVEHQILRLV